MRRQGPYSEYLETEHQRSDWTETFTSLCLEFVGEHEHTIPIAALGDAADRLLLFAQQVSSLVDGIQSSPVCQNSEGKPFDLRACFSI